MGQDGTLQGNRAVKDNYTFAWSGTRYCDLNVSEANLALIKDGLAEGYAKDAFIAITAHLVHRTTGLIIRSEDIPVEDPLSWEDAAQVVVEWYRRVTDEMKDKDAERIVEVEVKVK